MCFVPNTLSAGNDDDTDDVERTVTTSRWRKKKKPRKNTDAFLWTVAGSGIPLKRNSKNSRIAGIYRNENSGRKRKRQHRYGAIKAMREREGRDGEKNTKSISDGLPGRDCGGACPRSGQKRVWLAFELEKFKWWSSDSLHNTIIDTR